MGLNFLLLLFFLQLFIVVTGSELTYYNTIDQTLTTPRITKIVYLQLHSGFQGETKYKDNM